MKLRPAGISPSSSCICCLRRMICRQLIILERGHLRKHTRPMAIRFYTRADRVYQLLQNDCLYCGIRHSNTHADRYRLSTEQIMACCERGYELGFRTFVLQGGEDPYYTDERICEIVSGIKAKYPDCAVTLSIGEKSKESYQSYFDAGADRYLLRHETADEKHYNRLHPAEMSLANRKQCLWDLKEIGYQVGCGFMVGSPGQTVETLYEDLQFIKELEPHMVGIGPFISQKDTPLQTRSQVRWMRRFACFQSSGSYIQSAAACHNSAWHNPSARQGKGYTVGCQCCDAKPLTGQCS